jgi:hypothetical protein
VAWQEELGLLSGINADGGEGGMKQYGERRK